MKKFLKIFLGIIAGIFILLLILPFLFKGKIESKVKGIVNEQVNATVSWDKFSLSLIRNFPNLGMGLDGLTIINEAPFEGDTLVHIGSFSLSVDLMSAIKGDAINVKSILIDRPTINLSVNADSIANWDIMPETDVVEDAVEEETGEAASFSVQLQSFEIRSANITYADATMDLSSAIKGFNFKLKGDLTESYTSLNIATAIAALDVTMESTKFLNGATVDFRADIGADLDNMVFTFEDNELVFSKVPLFMEGVVAMLDEGIDMDLRLAARETEFKTLLALVPEEFMTDFEGLRTKGSMALEATAKGVFVDGDNLPAFNLLLKVIDGGVQYPELPKSIDNIQVDFRVDNPGGSPDNTVAEIKTFHFELDNNPFDAHFMVSTPISNAVFKGGMNGVIDLASLADAIPMDDTQLKGVITADLTLDGDYNMIDNELYEQIKADGNLGLKSFEFRSPDLPMGVFISQADLFFSPRYVELRTFLMTLGESDFSLKGRLENYLAYALKDGTLKGKLEHVSKYINTNELMALSGDEPVEETTTEAEPMGKVLIPGNIDFDMTTRIDRILYDKLELINTSGGLLVNDSRVSLNRLRTELLKGSMVMNGAYDTKDTLKPFVDFDLAVSNIDINEASQSFSMVEGIFPIASKAHGQVSTDFKFISLIGDDFSPVLNTFNGAGTLRSNSIEIKGSKVQEAMAKLLKSDKYNNAEARNINVKFKIVNGDLSIDPFDVDVFGKKVNISGGQNLDQTLNYVIAMPVTRAEIGDVAGLLGGTFGSSGGDLMVGISVTGTVTDPQLSLSAQDIKSAIKDEVRQEVTKAVEKAIEDVKEKGIEKATEEILKNEEVKDAVDKVGDRLRNLRR